MFPARDDDAATVVMEVDAVTAHEELIERVTVVRAIAMILLPLPRQVRPMAEPLSAELELAS